MTEGKETKAQLRKRIKDLEYTIEWLQRLLAERDRALGTDIITDERLRRAEIQGRVLGVQ